MNTFAPFRARNSSKPIEMLSGGWGQAIPSSIAKLSHEDQCKFNRFGFGSQISPDFPTVVDGFHHFVKTQPDAIAITHKNNTITYAELNARANDVAAYLLSEGVQEGDAVAIFLRRSIEMVIGIIAAHKIGAAYVPQDVKVCPMGNLVHIAAQTEAKVILTQEIYVDYFDGQALTAHIRPIETIGTAEAEIIQISIDPALCAMVLFTSGTTGKPNGVQVTHRNLANILLTAPGNMGIRPGTKVSQLLSVSFDMAAWEILGALSNGGTLIIRERDMLSAARHANVIIATPSILGSIDESQCPDVRVVAVAGEPCPRGLADLWGARSAFYNCCGPTETTIINTAETHFPSKEVLSIGRPTPNNSVYVLDENLEPLPIGEIGEMWAGGDAVTAGYLKNDELTADRYRDDPFRGEGHKMFRTRDLGRWTEEGELEHFGRVDDQVKVKGFRVELDGVTRSLEAAPSVERAVTLKFDNAHLVAFVSPANADVEDAMNESRERCPYYAVPAWTFALEMLPRTDRGKIDKRLLLELAQEKIDALKAQTISVVAK